ncbi:NAD(P)/FAD-dependent oxidoreductase [Aureimonas sp. AU12]|uniref:FAD/NAD(P)-dependent oxidoreductase n=1 Tax=Aureimonas sp. AU12 TaxID=1638161 RepID=UPI000780662D|nr:FAD/NAD(P)-binding oxidoreductase [Aureimonas sp. AU12]
MADPSVIVVGAGPAGMRASERLVLAGLRPIVIDEARVSGGQIYRRPPEGHRRSPEALYGFDAARARALHGSFDALAGAIDYRPETLAWALRDDTLHTVRDGVAEALRFDALILATGATDRLLPLPGWTLPGCYSLGGAQIALKAQGCAVGSRVVFLGTGPLLYLVAHQYAKAGVAVAAVLDTSPFGAQVKALPRLAARPEFLARGLWFRAMLAARRVPVHNGVVPLAVEGTQGVCALRWRDEAGAEHVTEGDAVAMGYHLRSETQLADLAGCPFVFDARTKSWRPEADRDGRSPRAGVYLAGDGVRILGADAAETAGTLAALAVLADHGLEAAEFERDVLRARIVAMERFRDGLAQAFPWPAHLARGVADDTILCRCEAITAGELREAARAKGAPELNRAKALSRIGMGRCQGRFCGSAAAEILADAAGSTLEDAGRLRGQAPVKPISIATLTMDEGEPA